MHVATGQTTTCTGVPTIQHHPRRMPYHAMIPPGPPVAQPGCSTPLLNPAKQGPLFPQLAQVKRTAGSSRTIIWLQLACPRGVGDAGDATYDQRPTCLPARAVMLLLLCTPTVPAVQRMPALPPCIAPHTDVTKIQCGQSACGVQQHDDSEGRGWLRYHSKRLRCHPNGCLLNCSIANLPAHPPGPPTTSPNTGWSLV